MKIDFKRATHQKITQEFLDKRVQLARARGFNKKQKWVQFCEAVMQEGLTVRIYEARRTLSKYLTVSNGDREFKVRFSNHRPIKHKELQGDCDFFVGVTHTGTRTTADALKATRAFFYCQEKLALEG